MTASSSAKRSRCCTDCPLYQRPGLQDASAWQRPLEQGHRRTPSPQAKKTWAQRCVLAHHDGASFQPHDDSNSWPRKIINQNWIWVFLLHAGGSFLNMCTKPFQWRWKMRQKANWTNDMRHALWSGTQASQWHCGTLQTCCALVCETHQRIHPSLMFWYSFEIQQAYENLFTGGLMYEHIRLLRRLAESSGCLKQNGRKFQRRELVEKDIYACLTNLITKLQMCKISKFPNFYPVGSCYLNSYH